MSTWGSYYHRIASQMALYKESNQRLSQLAELKPGMRVVDLGAGSGLTSLAALDLVPEGLHLILVDSSPSMLEEARRHLGDRIAAYHLADAAEAAALVEERVDRVLCNLSLLTFREPEAVLKAWRGKIKPTGSFCFNILGTYFNTDKELVSPQYALMQELHRRGDLQRTLPQVDRLPNQRSIEGTLQGAGFKPFLYEVQPVETGIPETEPGGELHSLLQLNPVLPGTDHQDGVARSLAVLPALAEAIAAYSPRWRIAHFLAQPSLTPDELLRERFGHRLQ